MTEYSFSQLFLLMIQFIRCEIVCAALNNLKKILRGLVHNL